jgi:hypothetical protein
MALSLFVDSVLITVYCDEDMNMNEIISATSFVVIVRL